ncbi:MAG: aminotransferase class I/II-fold pyridoxal phosphate-dependent enzyme [Anaerolineales bacterium]|nr:MAG: aminotransferase class I/II-fold pyridoxal phosphate-dependent enzyme [Anaerolineales bacterium]
MPSKTDFFFRGSLAALDPDVARLIGLETERQARKLILIPSESSAPLAVREAVQSVLMNVYAEGYPHAETRGMSEDEILDFEQYLAHYNRYGDQRYYRGVEYANIVESLARRRCAQAFATDAVPADQIQANVQPLSGAPANMAAMLALLEPGDTIMSMKLAHGGHLTHGSPANVSGKLYNPVFYRVNEETERLDYDEVEQLAREHNPKLIIAGYTSYPHLPDWEAFRQIADLVGAYLLADIAHVAGMVIAGVYPNPVDHAHVTSFTTHKTLCGPRAACLLTTDPRLAHKIDRAVFPGIQGGPHVNKFAAMATAFRLAQTKQFRQLQQQIVANASALAKALVKRGLRTPCGGTETHLLLVDCKTIRAPDGTPLMGGPTAGLLESIGLVVNRNAIPGDRSARNPSGIRLGTPWVTQRGLREPEMERIADVVARAMKGSEPLEYAGVRRPLYRSRIDFDLLLELRAEVAKLADAAGIDFEPSDAGGDAKSPKPAAPRSKGQVYQVEIEGRSAASFLEQITPTGIADLTEGEWRGAVLLEPSGQVMSRVLLQRPGSALDRYRLAVPGKHSGRVVAWLRALSDGRTRFDERDLLVKLPGPVVVRELGAAHDTLPGQDDLQGRYKPSATSKPYFVGLSSDTYKELETEALRRFEWQESEREDRRGPLFDWHVARGAKMAPFAGWEMPTWYSSISDEHHAVRESAGLFDLTHMGIFEITGPHAAYFLNLVCTNDVDLLRPGESQYTFLLAPHGQVLDDAMLYALEGPRYLMVVNAANAERAWAWLHAVNEGSVLIDEMRPGARLSFRAKLANLSRPHAGKKQLVAVALQGPRSRDILVGLLEAARHDALPALHALQALERTDVAELRVSSPGVPEGAFDLAVARTGYTGEAMGFELLLHPDAVPPLWEQLLAIGEPQGLRPIGLGARDSLRTEAGLPLYGHELEGPLDLRPDDAGFAGYVKLHKPFFIGRRACIEHGAQRQMAVIRFRIGEKGVRVPKPEDVVVDGHGRVIGQVTSCALDSDGHLVGQAYVDQRHTAEGTEINVFPRPNREDWDKPYDMLEVGDKLVLHSEARVIQRFLRRR